MPAVNSNLGVNSFGSGLITRVSVTKKVETKVIMDYGSNFGAAAIIDPTIEFTVEGYGDPLTTNVGTESSANPSHVGSAGSTIITSNEVTYKNDDFNSWKISGSVAPSAY